MDKLTDDEIIAKLKATDRAAGWMAVALIGAPVMLIAVFAAAFFTGHTALLQSEGVEIAIGALFATAILLLVLRFGRQYRSEAYLESLEPRIQRRRIDRHQRAWRWTLVSFIFSVSFNIATLNYALGRSGPNNPAVLLAAGGFVLVIAISSTIIFIGPGWLSRDMHAILNDDFIRALRVRAAQLGYGALMVAVAGALVVAVWRPDLTQRVLAWSLYAGFAVPALYYVIADWRASLHDDGRDG